MNINPGKELYKQKYEHYQSLLNKVEDEISRIESFFEKIKRDLPSRITRFCKNKSDRFNCETLQKLYARSILDEVPKIASQARSGSRSIRGGAGRIIDPLKELRVYRNCESDDFIEWGECIIRADQSGKF